MAATPLDRDREQLRETHELIAFHIAECMRAAAVVEINRPDQPLLRDERHAQDGTQSKVDHALRVTLEFGCGVPDQQRLARLAHPAHRLAAVSQSLPEGLGIHCAVLDDGRKVGLVAATSRSDQEQAALGIELVDRELHGRLGELLEVTDRLDEPTHTLQKLAVTGSLRRGRSPASIALDGEFHRIMTAHSVTQALEAGRGLLGPLGERQARSDRAPVPEARERERSMSHIGRRRELFVGCEASADGRDRGFDASVDQMPLGVEVERVGARQRMAALDTPGLDGSTLKLAPGRLCFEAESPTGALQMQQHTLQHVGRVMLEQRGSPDLQCLGPVPMPSLHRAMLQADPLVLEWGGTQRLGAKRECERALGQLTTSVVPGRHPDRPPRPPHPQRSMAACEPEHARCDAHRLLRIADHRGEQRQGRHVETRIAGPARLDADAERLGHPIERRAPIARDHEHDDARRQQFGQHERQVERTRLGQRLLEHVTAFMHALRRPQGSAERPDRTQPAAHVTRAAVMFDRALRQRDRIATAMVDAVRVQ